jgi:hypothetical protein
VRDAALARYRRDQDLRTLERTMAYLDEQEAEAKAGAPAAIVGCERVEGALGLDPEADPRGRREAELPGELR